MSKRQLLIGFGLGLMFSSGYWFAYSAENPDNERMTREQLQQAAASMNLVLLDQAEYKRLQEKATSDGQESPEAPQQPTPPASAKEPATPAQPGASAPGNQTAPPPQPPVPSPPAKPPSVQIVVNAGMKSAEVAILLVKAGLLPPDNQFVEKLRDQNKLHRIRTGTYQIPKGTSEDELIRLLTTPPSR